KGFAPLPSSYGRNPGLPGRGSSLRTALKGGVSNRSQFYDDEHDGRDEKQAKIFSSTRYEKSERFVIPAPAGIQSVHSGAKRRIL
ncbi:MAG: hypothetical protein LBI87_10890, partial [Candidatus Accumulibacter sp.]|nr:hypothetical protein [Accumulibacter sp.]